MGIRRELANALEKVDEELAKNGDLEYVGRGSKLQVVQTGIFASALRVVEFWNPNFEVDGPILQSTDPITSSSREMPDAGADQTDPAFKHGLSKQAWDAVRESKDATHGLESLLSGPLALLTMPSVSPQHLKAAIKILAPTKEFPAPKRRERPGYHEPAVQAGIQKMMLLGARVEGKVFDMEGARWVGGIEGGLAGLRGQLVAMLQSIGAGLTSTLEGASRSLYVTVEGRRGMLEEEEEGKEGSDQ